MFLRVVIFIYAILLINCADKMEPQINFEPPAYVQELPSKEDDFFQPNQGSLFGRGKNPLFSDRKAMQVNDVLTVLIEETTSSSSTTQKSLTKANQLALGGGLLTGTGVSALNTGTNITLDSKTDSSYSGSGTAVRNEQFTTTVTARVIKILNNGNYFIDGSRELLINGEKQIIKVSGVISPYNITANNEIQSRYISDAKIQYITEGELEQGTKRGWLARFFDTIWPF